jgi:hypothetical protein
MPLSPDDESLISAAAKGAVEATLQPLHDLIRDLAGPAFQEMGETWRDHVRVWRLQRAVRLAERVREILAPLGIAPRPVPLKILLPAIEHASLEDDDELQDRWAALLARAADPGYQGKMLSVFVDVLSQITPQDALFLDRCLRTLSDKHPADDRPFVRELGTKPRLMFLYAHPRATYDEISRELEDDFELSLANLIRIGLVGVERFSEPGFLYENRTPAIEAHAATTMEALRNDPITVQHYFLTPLGFQFVSACQT